MKKITARLVCWQPTCCRLTMSLILDRPTITSEYRERYGKGHRLGVKRKRTREDATRVLFKTKGGLVEMLDSSLGLGPWSFP